MKKVIRWIFIIVVLIIFAIDIAGFWKYKLKKNTNQVAAVPEISQEPENKDPYAGIEFVDLKSSDFKNKEKLFITNIEKDENEKYIIKGIIYEQYTVTKEEYNKIKNGTSVKIFGSEYKKDTIKLNNLNLKSADENSYDLYITYDAKSNKYVVKDKTTDYNIYKTTNKYVKLLVDEDFVFVEEKNGRSNESTVKEVEETHKNLIVEENSIKVNISTLTFDKKGICTKITELHM